MSDDDSYSDDNSEVESSDDESSPSNKPSKKPLFKPSINIKSVLEPKYDSDQDDAEQDDAEEDEADDDSVDDEKQTGGVGDETDNDDAESDEDDDDDDNIELDEEGEPIVKESVKKTNKVVKPKTAQLMAEDDEEEDDEYDDNYLQKFDNDLIKNYVNEFHPECLNHNYDEIAKLSVVVRNSDNIIVDQLHRTIPYLTKYEKARILGQRAKQIESGSRPLVKIPENIVDSYIIAELELREKKIPFIIRRPIPGGACEYWSLRDLEIISF
jgi:DNA-directed RNA polymerase I, II, and III subunit RPABC2